MAEPLACRACGRRQWARPMPDQPLCCVGCGEPWPGGPLAPPPARVEGFAHPPGHVGWGKRVDRMVAELRELD